MSVQFDTYDNLSDRRELMVLFQRVGEDVSELRARYIRANWLERLIAKSTKHSTLKVNPDSCHPVGAYQLFIQIVGVLGVPINVAAKSLDNFVATKGWHL